MANLETRSISLKQLNAWNTANYNLIPQGNSFELIILGEHHYRPRLQEDQLRLLRKIGPGTVLHEFLRTYAYEPLSDSIDRGNITQDQDDFDPKPHLHPSLLQAARKREFVLKGCDIGQAELRDLFLERLSGSNPRGYELADSLGINVLFDYMYGIKGIMPMRSTTEGIEIRDQRIATRLKDEVADATKPLVAIMGIEHAKNIHEKGMLTDGSFNYCIVDQSSVTPISDRERMPTLVSKGGVNYYTIPDKPRVLILMEKFYKLYTLFLSFWQPPL